MNEKFIALHIMFLVFMVTTTVFTDVHLASPGHYVSDWLWLLKTSSNFLVSLFIIMIFW